MIYQRRCRYLNVHWLCWNLSNRWSRCCAIGSGKPWLSLPMVWVVGSETLPIRVQWSVSDAVLISHSCYFYDRGTAIAIATVMGDLRVDIEEKVSFRVRISIMVSKISKTLGSIPRFLKQVKELGQCIISGRAKYCCWPTMWMLYSLCPIIVVWFEEEQLAVTWSDQKKNPHKFLACLCGCCNFPNITFEHNL